MHKYGVNISSPKVAIRETNIFDDPLLRADREAVIQLVLSEVDLWQRLLVLYLPNGLFNLLLRRTHVRHPKY